MGTVNACHPTWMTEYQDARKNGFNEVFVNAVRATGGNNAQRHLLAQGFNTNIGWTLHLTRIPS
jgi:endoglucanase